ncbi:MAG: hypothetical protein KAR79_02765, partial [Simkaniaceae bacterium]|nr:hypothetical protein [Simkaniaceae bacterium]
RIGFTRRYGQMDPKEREKWIKLLKENSSVIAFEEAANSEGLSLVDKLKDSVILGSNFQNWSMIRTHNTQYGYINITYIPPTQVDSYITECLEVVTMPVTNAIPMDTLFDVEKQQIQKDADENVEFHVLEESPLEIIYTYSHPKDHLQCNALVRGFHTDYGYYSIRYKRGLDRQLKKPEILQWKEKLKSISVKPSLAGSTNVVRESRND